MASIEDASHCSSAASSFQNSRSNNSKSSLLPRKRKYCSHCKEYVSSSTFRRHRDEAASSLVSAQHELPDSSEEEDGLDYVDQDATQQKNYIEVNDHN